MGTQTITVPNNARDQERKGYTTHDNIDTYLTGGDDVVFHDEAGNDINMNYFAFLADTTTERSLKFRGVGMTDAEAVTGSFTSGIFHPVSVHKIFSAGSTQNGNLRLRIE